MTKNYGLKGGTLDGTRHLLLAADPAAYMRRLAENPWMASFGPPRPIIAPEPGSQN